jgi:hypothetical protein
MTTETPQQERGPEPRLRRIDLAVLVAMAGTSGAGVVAHTFGLLEMRYSAPLIILPSAALLVGLIFARRGEAERVRIIADRLLWGAIWGFVATIAYDVVRPIIVAVGDFDANPFKAIPIFGSLIVGQPEDAVASQVVGWAYHFWNGISFGMMFALVRPRGAWLAGTIWGVGLQLCMMAVYPEFIGAHLDNIGFVTQSLLGHAVWGAVLGAGLARWGPRP